MSKREIIDILKYEYGFTCKEAENFYKHVGKDVIMEIISGHKESCKKAFYED